MALKQWVLLNHSSLLYKLAVFPFMFIASSHRHPLSRFSNAIESSTVPLILTKHLVAYDQYFQAQL